MKENDLAYSILKTLEEHYLCSFEINQKLKMRQIVFNTETFYPTLSKLQLSELLCYNWIWDALGNPVKYYHLTRKGLKYIQFNNQN